MSHDDDDGEKDYHNKDNHDKNNHNKTATNGAFIFIFFYLFFCIGSTIRTLQEFEWSPVCFLFVLLNEYNLKS